MNEHYKQYGLIGISILAMGVFVFFAFIDSGDSVDEYDGFVNPEAYDQAPLKQDIYAAKRRQERQQADYEREVTSLDDFLQNQVDKDPFGKDSAGGGLNPPLKEGNTKTHGGVSRSQRMEGLKNPPSPPLEGGNSKEPTQTFTGGGAAALQPTQNHSPNQGGSRRTGFASGGVEPIMAQAPGIDPAMIPVVVQESTSLTSGSTVKLRTMEAAWVAGVELPANTFITGDVTIHSNHILIAVTSIPFNGGILPVKLVAYDLNGNEGLAIEGGLEKEIADEVLQHTVDEVQDRVHIPLLKNVPFSSARKQINDDAVPIRAGFKLFLRSHE